MTKPEATLDQVKKSYPKLKQTDAALVAAALVLSGRYANVVHEGATYSWPEDYSKLTQALMAQLEIAQASVEPVKKTKASLVEEEAVEEKIGLVLNYEHGEKVLGDQVKLKTLFGEIVHQGVEFQYASTDIGWQWALDRANWATMSDGVLTRRVKLKAIFQGDAHGVETGTAPKRKGKKVVKEEAVELVAEAAAEEPEIESAIVEVPEELAVEQPVASDEPVTE